jgi:methionyl-tRNA formyltransferase
VFKRYIKGIKLMSNNSEKNIIENITILVDNYSWLLPYTEQLVTELSIDYKCQLVRNAQDIPQGKFCFLLGCMQIVSDDILVRNQHNFVVHESALPLGKGFAPMSWQILEGENSIPVCLLEASNKVDSGKVWLVDTIKLNGSELHDDWRAKQGEMTMKLVKNLLNNIDKITPKTQMGASTFYSKRTVKDSELDINKSLSEQFNLLRIVSNQDYPAFFIKDGIKYKLEISRADG